MKLLWHAQAWADYLHWINTEPKVARRLNALLKECQRTPFQGTGKPEPLKQDMKGWWSRRITAEDRLVYRVRGTGADQVIEVIQCRLHY